MRPMCCNISSPRALTIPSWEPASIRRTSSTSICRPTILRMPVSLWRAIGGWRVCSSTTSPTEWHCSLPTIRISNSTSRAWCVTRPISPALSGHKSTTAFERCGKSMQHSNTEQTAAVRTMLDQRRVEHVKIGVFDTDGILRGKYMSREKFESALEKGFNFCDVVLGWDSADQLYDNVRFTGWHPASPDASLRVLPGTCRDIPFEPETALFLAEFSGRAEAVC